LFSSEQAAEKLNAEGGGGFNPRKKARKIKASFSRGGTFVAAIAGDSEFFRNL
jgi:hypothetical protein